ncbi:MAG: hypothetical protein JWP29_5532 [Rhodoferax sp.]|nr:hypothetical protein [Rhodoferax sp.]
MRIRGIVDSLEKSLRAVVGGFLMGRLRRSEAQYRLLFESNPQMMWVCESQTLAFLEVNEVAVVHLGYSLTELQKMRLPSLLDCSAPSFVFEPNADTGIDTDESRIDACPGVDQVGHHCVLRTRQGSALDVEIRFSRIRFKNRPALMMHALDITERVRVGHEVRRLDRAQRMLSACNEAVIRATDEAQLLRQICEIAVDIGGYLLVWVGFAQDDEHKSISVEAAAGEKSALMFRQRGSWSGDIPAGQNAAGRAIRTGEIGVIADVHDDPHFELWRSFVDTVGHRGLIGLPLRDATRTFGALTLYAPDALHISEQESVLLEELANDLAFGINNLRSLNRQRRLSDAVLKVGAAVSAQVGDQFFKRLVSSLVDALEAQAGQVAVLLPGDHPKARSLYASVKGSEIPGFDFDPREGPCGEYLGRDAWSVICTPGYDYPQERFFARFPAESIAVRRLDNARGEPIGFLLVAFENQLGESEFVDALLRIFAARAASELERLQSDARLRIQASLLDQAQDAILVRDLNHHITYWNQGCERLYGWESQEVLGRSVPALVYNDPAVFHAKTNEVIAHGAWSGELIERRKDGVQIIVEARWTLLRGDDGQPVSILGINTDITRRKEAEEAVHRLAFFDALTGMPNRQMFNLGLQQAVRSGHLSGLWGALLYVNIDKFKAVNEQLGHVKGDLLLRLVAERMTATLEGKDTAARIGGDEFLILLEPTHADREAALGFANAVGHNILRSFAVPFALDEFEYLASACIGIDAFQGLETEQGELLKRVDLALYQAKAVGRGTLRVYDPLQQLLVAEKATLEEELRQALALNQLALHYQPQVHRDGRLLGAEALLRWVQPRLGNVSPAVFIPVAEQSGLILSIGQWVIQTACTQLKTWQSRPSTKQLLLSVNVSASQFRDDGFIDQVASAIRNSGIDPGGLKLELTESLLVYDMEAVITKMHLLKSHGVGLSLDDFGTGYSSLSYLKRMPLDQLKLDQAFVRDVMTDLNDAAIAETVIGLGHSLGLMVIAEGVEQADQRAFLFESGCDGYQGYLLSRPLPLDQFESFMAAYGGRTRAINGPEAYGVNRSPQQELRELTEIIEHTPDYVFQTDALGRVQHLNPSARAALGIPLHAPVHGFSFRDFFTAEAGETLDRVVIPTVNTTGFWMGETAILAQGERLVPVNQMVIGHRDAAGRIVRFSAVMRDISLDIESRQRLMEQTATLHSMAESIPAIVAVNGLDERYRFVNRAFEVWFGKPRELIVGRTSRDVLGEEEYERSRAWIEQAFAGETVSFEKHFPDRTPPLHMAVSFIPLRLDNGQIDGYVTMAQDVTLHRTEAVRLHQISERDALTGLLNRRGFEAYLDRAVQAGNAGSLALLYVDLDHFKPVNDQHGHPVGDVLLRDFANRLRKVVRPMDGVARMGGDEFAVVLYGVASLADCAPVAEKILAVARRPFLIARLQLTISASIGVAFNASDQDGWVGMVRRADAKLYSAKAAGRGRWA